MKKNTMLSKMLDVLFPPVCMFCKHPLSPSDEDGMCKDCIGALPFTENHGCFEAFGGAAYLIAPFFYKDGVKTAIRDLKFRAKYTNAATLAGFIAGYLRNIPEAVSADVIIPVPLSKKSYAKRGFNQSELLGKEIGRRLGLPLDTDVLVKTRETKRQSALTNFEDRAKNVLGAFACTKDLSGKTVLLLDDIYTTGATVYNCANALTAAGAAKVIAVTVANAHKAAGYSTHDYTGSRLVFDKKRIDE